jgi:concanavalin A-like lectin/glucanase superfamily protein
VHPVKLAWLLPVVAAGVALWVVLSWRSEPEQAVQSQGRMETVVAADASGNGHDGIIQGPAMLGRPGHDGTAFSFAEKGSWVMVPSSPGLNAGTSDFLVSVWLRVQANPPDVGETYDIVRKGIAYTVPGEYRLELLGNGAVSCRARDAAGTLAEVTSKQRLVESWHRIGCARTGRQWSVLVDDVTETETVDLGAVSNTVALSIGSKYGQEDRPLGLVDDVKLIIDREGSLTGDPDAAIRELEEMPPAAWWRLDETATTGSGR